jgi:L-ribulose-5-phosphate 3-epimerase UlaE
VALVQAVDSPWFQIYGDMANLAAQGFDPAGQYRLAGKHLVAAHVKDGLPNVVRGVPFGEGIVSFPGVFRALKDVGFSGPLLVEMWADLDRMGDPFGAVCAAREFVRRHVESS